MSEFAVSAVIKAVDRISAPVRRIASRLSGRLRTAIGGIASVARRATGALDKLLGPLTLIGGAAVVGGLAKLVVGYNQQADSLSKLARRAGISTQTYQELRHAFDLAGVSQERFDAAVVKFTRTVGEAKAGTGKLVTLLSKTSPELLELVQNADDSDAALNLIIEAMGALDDPTKRAALAAAAFGRAGQDMTLILENGPEALRAIREEVHRYGAALSDKALRDSENFVDAMARLKLSVRGVANSLFAELTPSFTDAMDRVRAYVVANRELLALRIREALTAVADALKSVDWKGLWEGAKQAGRHLAKLWTFIGGATGALKVLEGLIVTKVVLAVGSLVGRFGGLVLQAGKFIKKTGLLGKAFGVLRGVASGLGTILMHPINAFHTLRTIITVLATSAFTALRTALVATGRALMANPILAIVAAIGAATYLIIDNWTPISEFFKTLWKGVADVFDTAWGHITEAWKPIGEFFGDLWAGVTDVFRDAWDFIDGILGKLRSGVEWIVGGIGDVKRSLGFGGTAQVGAGQVGVRSFGQTLTERIREVSSGAGDTGRAPLALAVARAGGAATVGGQLDIRIEGPPGTRVDNLRSDNPAVPIRTTFNTGRRRLIYGGL